MWQQHVLINSLIAKYAFLMKEQRASEINYAYFWMKLEKKIYGDLWGDKEQIEEN